MSQAARIAGEKDVTPAAPEPTAPATGVQTIPAPPAPTPEKPEVKASPAHAGPPAGPTATEPTAEQPAAPATEVQTAPAAPAPAPEQPEVQVSPAPPVPPADMIAPDKQPPETPAPAGPAPAEPPAVQQAAPQPGEEKMPEQQPAPAQAETPQPQKAQPRSPMRRARQRQAPPADEEAKTAQTAAGRLVTIDFDNVDIELFIKFISELSGKNFIVDKAVKGKVTIISPTKITVEEAYKVFESVLEVQGFATVPAGSVTKIVPSLEARTKNIETRVNDSPIDPDDKLVTQIIPLEYADCEEIKKLFGAFVSKNGLIASYQPTGTLIVIDILSNIHRLLRILKIIDVEGVGAEISLVPIENASADATMKALTTVFQGKGGKKGGEDAIKIVADERTNSLIIVATEYDTLRVKQLIKLLDKEIPKGEGNIRVYYLQNAQSEDLAKVLTALPTQQPEQQHQKGKAPSISKDVQIVADKATNSLVITANKDDYAILEEVIRKLDIVRPMVYLEALIMEVNVDKDFNLGVEWRGVEHIGQNDGRNEAVFGGSGGIGTSGAYNVLGSAAFPAGFSLGILGEGITIGGVTFPTVGAVLQAYKKDSDVHIISTPQLLTTDNEEAEIKVGENVPYITKQQTSTTDIDYTTYEYKDVGVTLKITPQINQERFVKLKIFQEVIKLKKGTEEFRPTTLKRTAQTTVIVKDKNTVVIGGMIGESIEKGTYKIPCLGEVPIFGWLFKSMSSTTSKTNLFVFLTPHIIETPSEANAIYEEKQEEFDQIEGGVIKMYKRPQVTPEFIGPHQG